MGGGQSVEGQRVWVVGASSGIGRAMALEFARRGAAVVVSARRADAIESLVSQVREEGGRAEGLPFDATDFDLVPQVAGDAVEKFGGIDMLCLCQGISNRGTVARTDMSVERRLFEVNFFSYVALVKAVLPKFLQQKHGRFVVVSSVQGFFGLPARAPYSSSKHALHGYFESLRAEVAHKNINVNIIAPGYVKTELSIRALTNSSSETNGKMDESTAKGYPADEFARHAIDGVIANRDYIIIAQFTAVLALWLKRLFPSLLSYIMKRRGAKLD